MEQPELMEKPDVLQEKVIEAAYDFANTLRSDVDPMLDNYTSTKVCRTLTVAAAKLLESIGHKPIIKVKTREDGAVYHYYLEDPDLGIAIDFSPSAHFEGFKQGNFVAPEVIMRHFEKPTLVLPLGSLENSIMNDFGTTEIRDRGVTRMDKGGGASTWDHIHMDKMPDSIREKLEALR